jgi:hypothetical protein
VRRRNAKDGRARSDLLVVVKKRSASNAFVLATEEVFSREKSRLRGVPGGA